MNKKIDLSPIVGSQVLCEFQIDDDNPTQILAMLSHIEIVNDGRLYHMIGHDGYPLDYCRIYQHPDYWISNQHGELKLPEGLIINLARRDADEDYDMPSGNIELRHIFANDGQDVIAVQVTGLADGWEW